MKVQKKSSYLSTVENFQEIGELPAIVRIHVEKYQTARKLAATFTENQAVFIKPM